MKRILFTTTNLSIRSGGSEILWAKAASMLARKDNLRVAAMVKSWPELPRHLSEIVDNGGKILYLSEQIPISLPKRKILANRLLPSRHQFRPAPPASELHAVKEFSPDLVVVTFGDLWQRSSILDFVLERRIPYITNIQLVNEYSQGNDSFLLKQKQYLDSALVNCFLSTKNIALTEQLLGAKIPNAVVIRNPCLLASNLLPFPRTEGGYRLAFPARLHTFHKGLDLLLKVMAQEKWLTRNLHINCYGDGPNKLQLIRLKKMWGVENVNFLEHTDDVASIWSNHHGLIVSSRMEGQPMVTIEAMNCGRMVVTTNVGLGDDLVKNKENGFVAEAATADGIDGALEAAWLNRSQWRVMGELAFQTAKQFLKTNPVTDFASLVESKL